MIYEEKTGEGFVGKAQANQYDAEYLLEQRELADGNSEKSS